MVESLTEKTLELEERMNEIQEEKSDLVSSSIFCNIVKGLVESGVKDYFNGP